MSNRPFHGFGRHLGWGANTAKFTVNVWEKSGVWRSIIRERLTFCTGGPDVVFDYKRMYENTLKIAPNSTCMKDLNKIVLPYVYLALF